MKLFLQVIHHLFIILMTFLLFDTVSHFISGGIGGAGGAKKILGGGHCPHLPSSYFNCETIMKSATCTAFANQIASYNGNTTLLSSEPPATDLIYQYFYGSTPYTTYKYRLEIIIMEA